MTAEDDYALVLTPPARRAISDGLPEAVAAAVIEFLTSAVVQEPQRVGKPLRAAMAAGGMSNRDIAGRASVSVRTVENQLARVYDDLAGVWSARRATYRILYRIREEPREVVVLRVERRRDAYRPL